jgi:cytochrome c
MPNMTRRPVHLLLSMALAFAGLAWSVAVFATDEPAAQELAKASGCFKCHGVEKKKDGPALRDAAAKYRGTADAEEKLIFHVTSGERVKFEDGHEEEHKKVKTKNPNETRNLVRWILALEGGTKR